MDGSSPLAHDANVEARMIDIGGSFVPEAPSNFENCGVDREQLRGLALKLGYTVQKFSTEWMIEQLHLPQGLVMDLLQDFLEEKFVEILGESGTLTYLYTISRLGRERAERLFEISGYVGAAPVSLVDYAANLDWQIDRFSKVTSADMQQALSDLVLSDEAKQVVGLALTSGRSLLIHGPPGNGKTSVGRLLHDAYSGDLWIPNAIAVGTSIIRLFDPQWHVPVHSELSHEDVQQVDHRWIRIERPFIVVGGELTIEGLDLGYDAAQKYYEAPLHLKANGGTFLLDDLGRQRVEPSELLNRWIIPLEHQVDYLTLNSGQKIRVPLRHMLAISTSLDPDAVVDPAFMRRIGYRLHLDYPSAERYREIFERFAKRHGDSIAPGLVDYLIQRYESEGRPLRSSEAGELIERARDICRYENRSMELTETIMNTAWNGYFGNRA